MNGLLSPTEFQYDDESRGTAATRWTVWIRDFEVFMIAAGINKGAQKKATLLHVVGKAARDIYYSKAEDDDTYNDVKDTLADHFTPLRNVDFEIYKFSQLKQREQEAFDDFMVRLRETAARCDFTDTPAQLKRQIITGCKSLKLKEHILNTAAITIDQITQRARTEEVVINQAKLIQTQNNTQVKPHIIAALMIVKQHVETGTIGLILRMIDQKEDVSHAVMITHIKENVLQKEENATFVRRLDIFQCQSFVRRGYTL
jgi:hypothetical protein